MLSKGQTEARKLRSRLSHPIIDADGHWAEFAPHMREEFRRIGGDAAVEALAMASARIPNALSMSVAERRRPRIGQEAFWFLPTRNTLDRAIVMMGGLIRRPIPALAEEHPEASKFVEWYDVIGIDSEHDYDPVWEKCRELRIAPSFHNGARSILLRNSPSNFCYNHIGHFASAGHAICKALFFGGVTRRFPDLSFAFLEGGVGWGCMLYADLVGHWEKRNRQAIERTNPNKLNHTALLQFAQKYGGEAVVQAVRRGEGLEGDSNSKLTGGIEDLDDYFRCKIERKEDIRDLFVPRFYFGCEADDPINAWAFNRRANPLGARLNAIFSSDIGHFDVPDMAKVVPEAYELVEHGLITDDDFQDFMFANAVRFWGEVNPDFFNGTVIERAAADVLARATVRP